MRTVIGRCIHGVGLTLPPWRTTILYWAVSLLILVLITFGFGPAGSSKAVLWGIPLHSAFGASAGTKIQSAFVEMVQHVGTCFALPYLCFAAMRGTLRTFEPNFVQFLRFSSSSRSMVEVIRIGGMAVAIGLALLPLAAGTVFGLFHLGLSSPSALLAGASCGACLITSAVTMYVLIGLGASVTTATGFGVSAPLFLDLFSGLSRRGNWDGLATWLPVGLPYSCSSWQEPSLVNTGLFLGGVVGGRLLITAYTRRLSTNT